MDPRPDPDPPQNVMDPQHCCTPLGSGSYNLPGLRSRSFRGSASAPPSPTVLKSIKMLLRAEADFLHLCSFIALTSKYSMIRNTYTDKMRVPDAGI